MRKILQLTVLLLTASVGAWAQGVTTSGLNGRVADAKGESLPGATVQAVHVPSGTTYGTVTDASGYYRLPNTRVGGPYKITISFVGYSNFEQQNIFLTLGQNFTLDATLAETATQLNEITVSASGMFGGDRDGQKTIVNQETINSLPTISRSIADFARFNPLANIQQNADGFSISLAGQNNRYNAIYIDGAINNDVFGLAGSGTNGGQTGVQPISLDAIEQFQVSVSPFDIRQGGFSGGAINAVTRSGTNSVEGSAYYLFRNENFAGKTPLDREDDPNTANDDPKKLNPFTAKTYGFRLGGPVIKDKLFYFVNAELQRDETPQPFNFATYVGDDNLDSLNALRNKLATFGYDPGVFDANTEFLNSDKFLAKLDWNINDVHTLSLRHSYVSAENLEARSSSTTFLGFTNGSEYFLSKTNSTSLELKSRLSNTLSNKFVLGVTLVRDDRDPFGDPFPTVFIDDGPGGYEFGAERFSTANLLNQDVITLTNDLDIYKGKHTITVGTHNEYYNVGNLFIRENFGAYSYDRLGEFLNDINTDTYTRSFSQVDLVTGDESNAIAAFKGFQFGLYGQDEIQVTNQLRITAGLRFDLPVFPDSPAENADFDQNAIPAIEAAGYDLKGARPGNFIKPQLLVSPRVGFNWKSKADQTLQLRGGIGIFTSRLPLVWPGGAFNNYGFNIGGVRVTNRSVPFNPNVNQQFPTVDISNPAPSGQIDLFAEDFKLPQVFKLNAAVDKQLPLGFIGTFEAIYTKTLNNVFYQNLNLRPSTEQFSGTPDNRPIFNANASNLLDPTYTGIFLATNTNKGYSYNLVASVSKSFDFGLTANVGYTYGDSYSLNDGNSSQNNSQFAGYQNVLGRNLEGDAQRSNYSIGNRFLAQLSYRKEYLGFLASQISLFYNGQSGNPFSYVVNANNNQFVNDGGFNNSELIYVPANQSDIIFQNVTVDGVTYTPAQQWNILNSYIEDDKYLSNNRGQYAERNTGRTPFESILDLRFTQDVFLKTSGGKRNTLQFSLDIFNFGNMVNADWGRRYFISNGNFGILNFRQFQPGTRTPEYTLNANIIRGEKPWENNIIDSGFRSSRWQMQIGLRYIFGS